METSNLDMDSPGFDADRYLSLLLKEGSLEQVMDKENQVVKESQYLHSEMQTLVYENYNKFISATETVHRMRTDLKTMRDSMEQLAKDAEEVASFSEQVSAQLGDSGMAVSKLCGASKLLRRLHFLFLLPARMSEALRNQDYALAIRDYTRARRVLDRYSAEPSFAAIGKECEELAATAGTKLEERLASPETDAALLADTVALLVKLREGREQLDSLEERFLQAARPRISARKEELCRSSLDLLQWVELANEGLLSDLTLLLSSADSFSEEGTTRLGLDKFAEEVLTDYLEMAKIRFEEESLRCGTDMCARALDKVYRRVRAAEIDISSKKETEVDSLVATVINIRGKSHCDSIANQFREKLVIIRQGLAGEGTSDLKESLSSLQVFLVEKVQASLKDLTVFLQTTFSFGLRPFSCTAVANTCFDVIRRSIEDVASLADEYSSSNGQAANCPPQLLLILSELCRQLNESGIHCMFEQAEMSLEKVVVTGEVPKSGVALKGVLRELIAEGGRSLLAAYVSRVGLQVSRMLRVSVLSREWVRVVEPRGVRAVARRVLETLSTAERDVQQLFVSGGPTGPSSDSSRRTQSMTSSRLPSRSNWSGGVLDSSLASNINKLFAEKIEIFGPVEPTKVSILTGIVKIGLKTFLECARLRTYSKYGLQQMQVDIHYLQLYLWRFVQDENLVHVLLDEILSSVVNRCVEPQLMEPSVVDIICERG